MPDQNPYGAPEDEQKFKIAPPEITWTGHIPLEQLGFWKELIWRARAHLN